MSCSRCKPNRPCLSHSWIPFQATCWVELNHWLLTNYPERIVRESQRIDDDKFDLRLPSYGHAVKDSAARYRFSLYKFTFDETPLGYLDWLAGQDWLRPGQFKDRLFKYLGGRSYTTPCRFSGRYEFRVDKTHPIQRELDTIFPDRDLESYPPSPLHQHRWHGQCMPKELRDPPPERMTKTEAWEAIADFCYLDLDSLDVGTALEQMHQIQEAVKLLKPSLGPSLEQIRSKYNAVRNMARRPQHPDTEGQHFTARDRLKLYLGNGYTINPILTRRTRKVLLKCK